MDANSVTPTRVPGYWSHKKGSSIVVGAGPKAGEKVLYHLHGGAYIRLSAHPKDPTANIVVGILKHVPSIRRAFAIEYRLSSSEPFEVAHPFPSALLDAGGNLALALTLYLVENQGSKEVEAPAPPGQLVLLSPWVDLSKGHEGPGSSAYTNCTTDYIQPVHGEADYAKRSFLGKLGMEAASLNPYISPASLHEKMSISFEGFPRTMIVSGGAEVLLDQIVTLGKRMEEYLGSDVRQITEKDAVHDFLVFKWHEPERTRTLKQIAAWLH
jgi:acetyl esterase/lipase